MSYQKSFWQDSCLYKPSLSIACGAVLYLPPEMIEGKEYDNKTELVGQQWVSTCMNMQITIMWVIMLMSHDPAWRVRFCDPPLAPVHTYALIHHEPNTKGLL